VYIFNNKDGGGLFMKANKIIQHRRSVREYKKKKVDKFIIEDLFEDIKNKSQLKNDVKIDFYFIEDGEETFKRLGGLVGYFGKVIKAPHYIYLMSNKRDGYLENAGYIGEKLILKATELKLGTCWIEIPKDDSKVRKALDIQEDGELIALISIGYPKREAKVLSMYDTSKKGNIFPLAEFGYPNMDIEYIEEPVSGRLSIEDMVYLNEWGNHIKLEDLENRGLAEAFYYMRLAPSWGNRQPWKFIVDGEKIVLAVRNDKELISEKVARIEAGIAMLYFELMIHELGIPGGWTLEKVEKDYKIPEDYIVVGYYTV
jgi:hypothetical protein